MTEAETLVALDSKGRVVIPKGKRRARAYRLVDHGDRLELIAVRSFEELRGKYPLKGSLRRIEEEVEEKIVRRERRIWPK